MRTIVVGVSDDRYEVREYNRTGNEDGGAVLAIFTTIHEAVAYQQAYSLGRY